MRSNFHLFRAPMRFKPFDNGVMCDIGEVCNVMICNLCYLLMIYVTTFSLFIFSSSLYKVFVLYCIMIGLTHKERL